MKSNTLNNKLMSTKALVTISLLTSISIILARVMGIMIPVAGFPALKINFSTIPIMLSGILFGPVAGFMTGGVADVIGYLINPQGGPFFPGFTLSTALTGMIPGLVYKVITKYDKVKKINFNYINGLFIILTTLGLGYAFYAKGVLAFSHGVSFNGQPIHIVISGLIILAIGAYIILPFYITKAIYKKDNIYSFDKLYFTVSITQIITSLILNTYFLSILFGKGVLVFLPTRIVTNYIMIPVFTMIFAVLFKTLKLDEY
ncbi:MAG: folate family ECF transporter S component [Bacillota bacterium]|nr:folate family ECF transporter S component [Bacillota bacterium]